MMQFRLGAIPRLSKNIQIISLYFKRIDIGHDIFFILILTLEGATHNSEDFSRFRIDNLKYIIFKCLIPMRY